MKKLFLHSLLVLCVVGLMAGCAQKAPVMNFPDFVAQGFDTDRYAPKVDQFIVILDASSSMDDAHDGAVKFDIAKTIADRLNMTLPEMGQTAGLRTFGHHDEVSENLTELFYGMSAYKTEGMAGGLAKVTRAGGWSPMSLAIDAADKDLSPFSRGQKAVIFITDGLDMKGTLSAGQKLKNAYGEAICFYPILVGNKAEGRARLEQLAGIGGCGFFSLADELMTGPNMAAFVEKVFLTKVDAPAPMPTPKKDTDQDGVYDAEDQCPGTPQGARVSANGCWSLNHVLFDFDKSVIKPAAHPVLDEVVAILKKNPAMSVELQGHTDNIGSEAYNLGLSLRRAQAVAAYLVDQGILRNRLATTGLGYSQPVALNGTKYGRALNRRVEIHPY